MQIEIYHADMQDIPFLMEQAKEFSKFADYKGKQLYPGDELAEDFFEKMINQHVVFVAKALKPEFEALIDELSANGGTLKPEEDVWIRTGFIAGLVSPHIFNPDIIMLAELFWWVSEEYRRGRSGLMLFNIFRDWGIDHVDQILMTLEEESPVKHTFLTKRGFRVKEHSFLLEVDQWQLELSQQSHSSSHPSQVQRRL